MRQDELGQDQIQVVQELIDSQEAVVGVVEQSDAVANPSVDVVKPVSVENNEIENKPTAEKPVNENDPNPINKVFIITFEAAISKLH